MSTEPQNRGLGELVRILLIFHVSSRNLKISFLKKSVIQALHWITKEVSIWHVWREWCNRRHGENPTAGFAVCDQIWKDLLIVFDINKYKEKLTPRALYSTGGIVSS